MKKILIVEDEPDVVQYLSSLLEDSGFKTVAAYNGKEGMELAKKEKPALITLDITMPEESGVRMFRNLQEDPETKDIPVVMVTGVDHAFKKFIESRKQLKPPAAYFDKPIDQQKFIAKIKELVGTD